MDDINVKYKEITGNSTGMTKRTGKQEYRIQMTEDIYQQLVHEKSKHCTIIERKYD